VSYCVFITRRLEREETNSDGITLDEWQAIVDSDDELVVSDDYRCATWNGVSSLKDASFEWDDGEVLAHNPDTAQLTKMRELAGRLGGRVVTEDGFEIHATGDEGFDPATAYSYDLDAARKWAHTSTFGGLRGFLLYHVEIIPSVIALLVVAVRAVSFPLQWGDYIVVVLAGSVLGLYFYYSYQERLANEFRDWLLRNVKAVVNGTANYQGTPVTLATQVTRFSGAYSFVFSNHDWSRWYVVGADDRKGKWLHNAISILFGSWGLPLGPLEPAMALMINLPGGDKLTIRNLYLRLDDRLCHLVGALD